MIELDSPHSVVEHLGVLCQSSKACKTLMAARPRADKSVHFGMSLHLVVSKLLFGLEFLYKLNVRMNKSYILWMNKLHSLR